MNRFILPAIFLFLLVSPAQAQTTWYVDQYVQPSGNGHSWATAFNDLQDALNVAHASDEIWVAEGIYLPSNPSDPNDARSATFQLLTGVSIYAGFPTGGGNGTFSSRDPETYTTILSGDIGLPDNDYDNSYHVVTGSGTDVTSILDGVTISGGYANRWASGFHRGGGMYNDGGSPTVAHCTLTHNYASDTGGGLYNANHSNPEIAHCTITENYARSNGGGAYVTNYSSPTIRHCTVSNNISRGQGGGAWFSSPSQPVLTDCLFVNNTAELDSGGGLYLYASSNLDIRRCTISGNTTGGMGGGLYCENCIPSIVQCIISNNSAIYYGGGVFCSSADPLITHNIIVGNYASDYGGGIYCSGSSQPVISHCAITNNASDYEGGGIHCYYSSPTVVHCTITNNAGGHDAGCGFFCSSNSSPTVRNCIVWGNSNTDIVVRTGASPDIAHTAIEGGWPGDGCINASPLFVAPSGVDGDPDTWEDNNYHLSIGSPCIDSADNTAVPLDTSDMDSDGDTNEKTPVDLEGKPRFVDDPGATDVGMPDPPHYLEIVDMGVYEFQLPMDCNGNGMPDEVDVASGTSIDCNTNSIPDECEYPGCIGILLADTNCDRRIDGADLQVFVRYFTDAQYTCQADMNQDGFVDEDDVFGFVKKLLGYVGGDVNGDGTVDIFDIDAFLLTLIDRAAFVDLYPNGNIENADMNDDGLVDGNDIQLFVEKLLGS